ncbi:tRNA synthetase class II (G H P and S) [Beutenbergia cavernae DSM 12333]|uniref:Threonine--tRNA ligase n=1 Tax=Beutenbergia cavernae (strain ATCC BAA-8 / DSM 12333 / CCUG 43141 / JCM 11478 / NBRC 16432 / NCIMB 13614 / HKI 0122) TaxID=471853 RepID=C5C172_BEUC1|nr:threonine--tRNA ligase [Beutenbergia cavernae]ACQ79476.1 tRNA synthetase class II (G H P and S) [Beutenbergia cavernae DSM 12333]
MTIDHRRLGRDLGLFATSAEVGAGLPLWLPDGAVIRGELEAFSLEQALASGCRRVYTPVLAKRSLFERSGHWAKFSGEMFPEMPLGGESLVLRPVNCPHHTQVFAAEGRSYRDLPFRLAEVGSMFRSELSGVVGGLSRVRQINLDDAHSFCAPDQVADEVALALRAIRHCYDVLGIDVAYYRLSVRGDSGSYLGDDASWHRSERYLREALDELGLPYERVEGEAAIYGPKIDVQVADARGREETLSTVQVDEQMPGRFGLTYTGDDGARHRPVLVHRGLLSSMERMTALLVELHDGRMPTWLAPVQVRVLPVADRHADAAGALRDELARAGVRAEVSHDGSLGRRIRDARERRDTYLAVLGDGELASGTVDVTAPATQVRAAPAVAAFVRELAAEIRERRRVPAAHAAR